MTMLIESITGVDRFGDFFEEIKVYDGEELIAHERYGGEPEDNRRSRDYKWVEPLLKQVIERCGEKAELVKVSVTENE
jgi:hypothetical protein